MNPAAARAARHDSRASRPDGSGAGIATAGRASRLGIKVSHALKLVEPVLDFGGSQLQQSSQSEVLHRETCHHGTVDQGAAEITHESAGKGVACAGWIAYLFERISGREENTVILKQAGPVLASLDHER